MHVRELGNYRKLNLFQEFIINLLKSFLQVILDLDCKNNYLI